MAQMEEHDCVLAVIGLGYVGLPLAVEFAKSRRVIGFDINSGRVEELLQGEDRTREVEPEALASATYLTLTSDPGAISCATVFIVTVPTPIDRHNRPDLTPLIRASETVGRALKKGDVVIYESTVYPGATEEECVPVLERVSGLTFNSEFFCGYSPERINPGDKLHRLPNICKITSGSTPAIADFVDALYASIIQAGTYKAEGIRVAEAAKVIENTQRDINIALINELAIIFNRMDIDTNSVLKAAGTKWNFLPFRPGLVGGHCIGVDPYYLTHKAQELGYYPQVILAGRRINDFMAQHVADQTIKLMLKRGIPVLGSRILILGATFKENCPDTRNSKVLDVVKHLQSYHAGVDVYDPVVDIRELVCEQYVKYLTHPPDKGAYDAIVIAVGHQEFVSLGTDGIRAWGKDKAVIYDVKSILPSSSSDGRL